MGYWSKPAKWYHFWLPQSGVIGGLILGPVVTFIVIGICLLLK